MAAAMSTGRGSSAFRRKRDAGNLSAIRAVARARPINSAGAQTIARRVVRNAMSKNLESKYWPLSGVTDNTSTPYFDDDPNLVLLSGIPQSTTAATDRTRIGDTVMFKSMEFRANLYGQSANSTVRVMIFQWKEVSSTTVPNAGLILNIPAGGTYVNAYYNRDMIDSGTLRVLADWRFDIANTPNSPDHAHTLFFKTKKMAKHLQFNAATTVEGKNNIYLLYVCTTSNATPANLPNMFWTSVCDFTDA